MNKLLIYLVFIILCSATALSVAPAISSVVINPSIPFANQTLEGNVTGTDADGDTLIYQCKWYLNNTFNATTSEFLNTVNLSGFTGTRSVYGNGTNLFINNDTYLFAYTFDGMTFTKTGSIDLGAFKYTQDIVDNATHIFTANEDNGISALTFNGTNFTLLASLSLGGVTVRGIDIDSNDIIHSAASGSGLYAHSFNGTAFNQIDVIDNGGTAYDVFFNTSYYFLANHDDGLRAYTFNGTNYTNVGNVYDGDQYRDVYVRDHIVYVATTGGVRTYSFNGTTFTNLANFSGSYTQIFVDEMFVYAGQTTSGFKILSYDGADGFQQIYTNSYTGNGWGIYSDTNYTYFSALAGGLQTYAGTRYAQATNINYANISDTTTSTGDSWIFSCRASDGTTATIWTNSTPVNVSSDVPILNVSPSSWSTSQDNDDQFNLVFNVSNTGADATNCTVNTTNTTLNTKMSYSPLGYNVSSGNWTNVNVIFNNVGVGNYVASLHFDCNGERAQPVPSIIFAVSVVTVTGGGGEITEEIILGYETNFTITPPKFKKRIRPGSEWIHEFKITNSGDVNLDISIFANEKTNASEYFSFLNDEKLIEFELPAINQFDPNSRFVRYKVYVPEEIGVGVYNVTLLTAVEGVLQNVTYELTLEVVEGIFPEWWYKFWDYPLYTYKDLEVLEGNRTALLSVTEEQECIDEGSCLIVETSLRTKHAVPIIAIFIIILSLIIRSARKPK